MNIRPSILDRNPATAEHFASLMEKAPGPLDAIFGDCDFVYIVAHSERGFNPAFPTICQDIFPGKRNDNSAFRHAYETFVDSDHPHHPNPIYRGCIRIDRDGKWEAVKLFSGE